MVAKRRGSKKRQPPSLHPPSISSRQLRFNHRLIELAIKPDPIDLQPDMGVFKETAPVGVGALLGRVECHHLPIQPRQRRRRVLVRQHEVPDQEFRVPLFHRRRHVLQDRPCPCVRVVVDDAVHEIDACSCVVRCV